MLFVLERLITANNSILDIKKTSCQINLKYSGFRKLLKPIRGGVCIC